MRPIPPIKRNEDIELPIHALGSEGQGVGRYRGMAVFVPFALPGERVRAHIIKVASNYAVGKLMGILEASPLRVEPRCQVFGRCGGCTMMHMGYASQLQYKQRQVVDALERIARIPAPNVLPILGMDDPWRYRNKGSFPLAEADGRIDIGFFAPRSHRLVPIDDCPISSENVVRAALAARDWARANHVAPYDEESKAGVLRHIVTRTTSDGSTMVTVVTASDELPARAELIERICAAGCGAASIVHSVNPDDTNVIFGKEFSTVWGEKAISERMMGLEFEVSAASFMQVNACQTAKLYQTAIDFMGLSGNETAADLYCGIGTLTLLLARSATHVIGIENVAEAVADARENAKKNGLSNVDFIAGDAEIELPRLIAGGFKFDAIMMDPPRKGCEAAVLDAVIDSGAPKLVYVSCNPATLARDCKRLAECGFELIKAQPVDMFPHSAHVETVVLMSRVEK